LQNVLLKSVPILHFLRQIALNPANSERIFVLSIPQSARRICRFIAIDKSAGLMGVRKQFQCLISLKHAEKHINRRYFYEEILLRQAKLSAASKSRLNR